MRAVLDSLTTQTSLLADAQLPERLSDQASPAHSKSVPVNPLVAPLAKFILGQFDESDETNSSEDIFKIRLGILAFLSSKTRTPGYHEVKTHLKAVDFDIQDSFAVLLHKVEEVEKATPEDQATQREILDSIHQVLKAIIDKRANEALRNKIQAAILAHLNSRIVKEDGSPLQASDFDSVENPDEGKPFPISREPNWVTNIFRNWEITEEVCNDLMWLYWQLNQFNVNQPTEKYTVQVAKELIRTQEEVSTAYELRKKSDLFSRSEKLLARFQHQLEQGDKTLVKRVLHEAHKDDETERENELAANPAHVVVDVSDDDADDDNNVGNDAGDNDNLPAVDFHFENAKLKAVILDEMLKYINNRIIKDAEGSYIEQSDLIGKNKLNLQEAYPTLSSGLFRNNKLTLSHIQQIRAAYIKIYHLKEDQPTEIFFAALYTILDDSARQVATQTSIHHKSLKRSRSYRLLEQSKQDLVSAKYHYDAGQDRGESDNTEQRQPAPKRPYYSQRPAIFNSREVVRWLIKQQVQEKMREYLNKRVTLTAKEIITRTKADGNPITEEVLVTKKVLTHSDILVIKDYNSLQTIGIFRNSELTLKIAKTILIAYEKIENIYTDTDSTDQFIKELLEELDYADKLVGSHLYNHNKTEITSHAATMFCECLAIVNPHIQATTVDLILRGVNEQVQQVAKATSTTISTSSCAVL